MSPRTAMRRPPLPVLARPKQGQCSRHGNRIGIVALINQQQFTGFNAQVVMNPPALCRLGNGQRQRRAGQIGTHHFHRGQHRKAVEHHMLAGHAKLVDELLAHDVGRHATACGMQHHALRLHVGFFMGSKTDDVLNARRFAPPLPAAQRKDCRG